MLNNEKTAALGISFAHNRPSMWNHASPTPPEDLTGLIRQASCGERDAAERLLSVVLSTLQRIARRARASGPRVQTLQTADLVNEAYLRLFRPGKPTDWNSRHHFLSVAAKAMRSILVDYARKQKAAKRPPSNKRLPLDDVLETFVSRARDMEELDQSLSSLSEFDAQLAHIVELRFFAGLKIVEIAQEMSLEPRTTERRLAAARAWLRKEMERGR